MNEKSIQNRVSLGQVFREGSFLLQTNFGLIIMFVFCVYGPLNLIRSVIPYDYLTDIYGKQNITLLLTGINWVHYFLALVAYIGIAYIVEKVRKGELPSLKSTLQFAFSRLADVFWTSILLSIICFGWTLLLIIPGIIWANYYSFALFIVSIRGIKGKAALDYSNKLVKGQWWKIFGIQFVIFIASLSINLPMFILSSKISKMNFFYIFLPLTISNIVGAIVMIMAAVLFLNVEYAKDSQKQSRIAK